MNASRLGVCFSVSACVTFQWICDLNEVSFVFYDIYTHIQVYSKLWDTAELLHILLIFEGENK